MSGKGLRRETIVATVATIPPGGEAPCVCVSPRNATHGRAAPGLPSAQGGFPLTLSVRGQVGQGVGVDLAAILVGGEGSGSIRRMSAEEGG